MKPILTAGVAIALLTTPMMAATKITTLKVPGMVCAACPITVRKALQRVQGVSTIDVNYPRKEVVVTFDDAKTNEAELLKATASVGFPSQVVRIAK